MQQSHGTVFYHAPWEPSPTIHIDVDGVVGQRIDAPLEPHSVRLLDARSSAGAVSYARDGIEFLRAPTRALDFENPAALAKIYDPELEALVCAQLGAIEAVIFDHTLRTDAPGPRPPARHAHGDYTPASARTRMRAVLGEDRAAQWAQGQFGIVNAWRPLRRVERAPLAFARPATVAASDWVDVELVYPHRRGHIRGLLPSHTHEWVYMPNMDPEQLVLFRVHDSRGLPAVAHSAVDLDEVPADAGVRQSLESRILVRFS